SSGMPPLCTGPWQRMQVERGELLDRHAEDHVIEILPVGVDHASEHALADESQAFVQAQRRLVEAVDVNARFLVAKLAEEVAQEQNARLGGVALSLIFRTDADAIAEGAVAAVAQGAGDRAGNLTGERLDHEEVLVLLAALQRLLRGPLTHIFLGR